MDLASAAIVAVQRPSVKTAVLGLDLTAYVSESPRFEFLSDLAPREKPWDEHRSQAEEATGIYRFADSEEYPFSPRYAQRIGGCSGCLEFVLVEDLPTGERRYKLRWAWFCKVRTCPVCQWRRSLMYRARFLKAFDKLDLGDTPAEAGVSFIWLTLTVTNPDITDLRTTLKSMTKAWDRFTKRKEFANIVGWVRSTEVTWSDQPNYDAAHPHFHVLMMVRNSWFKKSYVSQESWTKAWKEAARLDYQPSVWVEKVGRKDESGKKLKGPMRIEDLKKKVTETLKYAVKTDDMLEHHDWFLELTRQVRSLKFIASGGDFKGWFREEQEESQMDLMLVDHEEKTEIELANVAFEYRPKPVKRYTRMIETRRVARSS